MANAQALGQVLISQPNNVKPQLITPDAVDVSWAVSRSGQCVIKGPERELSRLYVDEIKGLWLTYTHPSLGPWRGIITDDRWTELGGQVAITAQTMDWGLRKRITKTQVKSGNAPAGSLINRAFTDLARSGIDDVGWLASISVDEDTDPIIFEWRGDDFMELVESLADSAGLDWQVGTDYVLRVLTYIGTDRRRSVCLMSGKHIVDGSRDGSIQDVTNAVLAIADDDQYAAAEKHYVQLPTEIENRPWGRREETRSYVGVVTESTIRPKAIAELKVDALPRQTLTVDTIDFGGVWNQFREGDIIGVHLRGLKSRLYAEVRARSYSTDSGVCKLDLAVI